MQQNIQITPGYFPLPAKTPLEIRVEEITKAAITQLNDRLSAGSLKHEDFTFQAEVYTEGHHELLVSYFGGSIRYDLLPIADTIDLPVVDDAARELSLELEEALMDQGVLIQCDEWDGLFTAAAYDEARGDWDDSAAHARQESRSDIFL